MTDLTEQWKNGELEGEYYIETINGEIYNVEFQNSISVKKKKLLKIKSFKGYVHKKTVKEVLAPVPSYEEWKAKLEENTKLKAVLKRCREFVDDFPTDNDERWAYKNAVSNGIDELLGEE